MQCTGWTCNVYYPFGGLDVCLKRLAERISRMFLYPNWAERQQNTTYLCLAQSPLPHSLDIWYFIQFPSRLCKPKLTGVGTEKPCQITAAQCSCTSTRTGAEDWKEMPAGGSLSLQRQETQMAEAKAGDQIRWKVPNGWAMSFPHGHIGQRLGRKEMGFRGKKSVESSPSVTRNDEKLQVHEKQI